MSWTKVSLLVFVIMGSVQGSATLFRDSVGQGYDISNSNLWDFSNLYPVSVYSSETPDSCFREQPCPHGSSYHLDDFRSTEDWAQSFASGFGFTLGGGYEDVMLSISASYSHSFTSTGLADKTSFHFRVLNQQKCVEVNPDCLYNKSYLRPDLLSILQDMPMDGHDEQSMKKWDATFIGRFGTHISVVSKHGAQIQSLVSLDTSCHAASDCLRHQACLELNFMSYVKLDLCGNGSTTCEMDKGCTSLFEESCVIRGGDPTVASNDLCRKNSTAADLSRFLASGNMSSPSSAFGFTFKAISDVLSHMGMPREASMLEKAVEYHSCIAPDHSWIKDASGDYSCVCNLTCNNGGELDATSCTCKCLGNQYHGWHGARCDEAYGECQMGLDSGNQGSARKCSIDGSCKSWVWGDICRSTDVCCLTDIHGACCPFGSTCDCDDFSCSCLVPPPGCTKADAWKPWWGKNPEDSCQKWWSNCDWGACHDINNCTAGSFGDRECSGTCCTHREAYGTNVITANSWHNVPVII